MKIKDGVRVQGLRTEILLALTIANDIWKEMGINLTVTSGIEGRHSTHSLHYSGCAVDLRIWGIDAQRASKELQEALGEDYMVLLESDHIHLAYKPKHITGKEI